MKSDDLTSTVSVCSSRSLNWLSYWKAACVQLRAVSHALLFGVLLFGVESGFGVEHVSFIDDWISIIFFTFGQSVSLKIRRYSINIVCQCHLLICETE